MTTERVDPIAVGLVANRLHRCSRSSRPPWSAPPSAPWSASRSTSRARSSTRSGEMVGQSTGGTPGHINAMATGMRHFVDDGTRPSGSPTATC